MNKIYCANTSCAKVTYYEAAKPKFCAHCGQPFSGGFNLTSSTAAYSPSVPAQRQQPSARPAFTFQIKEDDVEPEVDIGNLQFKMGVANIGRKMTLGDLQNGAVPVADSDRPAGNFTDIKQVQAETRKKFAKPVSDSSVDVGE